MQFDNLATVDALAKLPPEAPKIAESKTSAWTAPLRAVPAAVAETLAGAAEVGTAAYRSLQQMDEGGSAGRRQRDRFGVQPVTGETEVSRSLRNTAEGYGPDPVTAGEAERLVFGLTRGVGKAVAYGLTTGPAAPFLFGADEGLTQMDQLQRQGVDTATAAKAGAVSAAVNAAGFLIPVAGKTIAGTIGLGALSGPASFVAQQAGTREILRAADYGQIADQFDPLDPVGLGVSLLPFGFGAWAMRARVKGGARPAAEPVARGSDATAKPEAARVQPADAPPAPKVAEAAPKAEPAPPAPETVPAAAVEPVRPTVQQEHVDAAMVHNLTLAADHAEAMHSPPMESLADFSARVMPPASDASPTRAGPDPFLKFLKANGGVNFADKFDITGEANGIRLNRGGVFTKAGKGLDDLAQIAESEGWLPPGSTADVDGGVPQLRDMLQRSMAGERIKPLAQQFDDIAARHMATSEQLRAEALAHRLEVLGVDPAPARGDADVMAAYLDQHEPRLLRQALADIAGSDPAATPQPKATPEAPLALYHGTQHPTVTFDELSAMGSRDHAALGAHFTTSPETAQLFAGESGRVLEGVKQFSNPIEIPDQATWSPWYVGRAIDEAMGVKWDGEMSPLEKTLWDLHEKARLSALDSEPPEIQALRSKFSQTPAERELMAAALDRAAQKGADAAADAIRTHLHASGFDSIKYKNLYEGEPVDTYIDIGKPPAAAQKEAPVPQAMAEPAPTQPTDTPTPQDTAQATAAAAIEPGSGPDAALIESVRRRGEQVVAEAPDLVVGMTEDGQPITARQELERIRREAAEGTADELGADDAPLLDVAVQCALSVGE